MRIDDRILHRLAVLKTIRRLGPISRVELAARSRLSGGTITHLTADLLKRGLITETKEAGSNRLGRPKAFLEIDASGGVVIGASIEVGFVTVAFVDLAGRMLHSARVPRRKKTYDSFDEVADQLAAALREAIAHSPFETSRIDRIGVAIPAFVDNVAGVVHRMVTLPPGPYPLAGELKARIGLPVTIESEIACKARAEHWFGHARELDTFSLVDVGWVVTSAQYVDGVPRTGMNGFNPEIGHMKTAWDENAQPCYCGARGCLSAYCSTFGMVQHSVVLSVTDLPNFHTLDASFTRILEGARSGDADAREAVEIAGRHLGVAVANHITSVDPGHVLITFRDADFLDLVSEPFQEALRAAAIPEFLANTAVRLEPASKGWRWKGTAALALEQTYLGQ